MLIHLFTIDGHEMRESKIGLLPGIPQSLLAEPQIGRMSQGSPLVIILPDGKTVKTKMINYYLNLPAIGVDANLLRSLPLIPVLPPDIGIDIVILAEILAQIKA